MISASSLGAVLPLGAELTFCSWEAGWKRVLLRGYDEPLSVEDYTTTATEDLKIVLVTKGTSSVEYHAGAQWRRAEHRPGCVGLIEPGQSARVHWWGSDPHRTLQMHIPGEVVTSVSADLFGVDGPSKPLGDLALIDALTASTMLSLHRAVRAGAPEMYGEIAAHFLTAHLLVAAAGRSRATSLQAGKSELAVVEDFLRANLKRTISLAELAELIGLSRYQLLRVTKRFWGETPHTRLTRLRVERAQELLLAGQLPIGLIAFECGFANSGHLSTCFKKLTGVSPSAFKALA